MVQATIEEETIKQGVRRLDFEIVELRGQQRGWSDTEKIRLAQLIQEKRIQHARWMRAQVKLHKLRDSKRENRMCTELHNQADHVEEEFVAAFPPTNI